jgi:hypothetical protein
MGAASHIIDMLLGFSYIARLSYWGRNLLVQMKSTCLKEGEGVSTLWVEYSPGLGAVSLYMGLRPGFRRFLKW